MIRKNSKKNIGIFLGSFVVIMGISWFFIKRVIVQLKSVQKPIEWTIENSLLRQERPPELGETNETREMLIQALNYSLRYYETGNSEKRFSFGPQTYPLQHMKETLHEFKKKLEELGFTDSFFTYVRNNYTFYQTTGDSVLTTGYYEAQLKGSLKKSDIYQYPLYKKPDDILYIRLSDFPQFKNKKDFPGILKGRLVDENLVVPYFSREEIDAQQNLSHNNFEIVWIDNAIDVFFLQIQGSGIVSLDNGAIMRVNYAESNGHPYRAIGRLLIQQEIITREDMSMQSIRKYLEDNPEKVEEVFNYNPSYVFFREVEEGPLGCLGVPVTAYRSIATDRKLFPDGALCYVETQIPVFNSKDSLEKWIPFSGFVLNQDTGGAIKTPERMDLFTGFGKESELVAGSMKQKGALYFLIKKTSS